MLKGVSILQGGAEQLDWWWPESVVVPAHMIVDRAQGRTGGLGITTKDLLPQAPTSSETVPPGMEPVLETRARGEHFKFKSRQPWKMKVDHHN